MNAISARDLSRDEWLAERRKGIGSSDAPIVCGLSPWMTPRELYHQKRGEIPEPDLSDNEAVEMGIALEDLIAKKFAERTGFKVRKDLKIRVHPDHPFMMANLDRTIVAVDASGPGVLECKTTSAFKLKEWGQSDTDEVPEHYLVQVQHQLAVTGFAWAYLAVLIGGQKLRYYRIPRDEDLILALIQIESDFWSKVQAGTPPDYDFSAQSTPDLLQKLYPGTDGSTVQLDDPAFAKAHKLYAASRKAIARLERMRDAAAATLAAGMGSAAIGLIPSQGEYVRTLVSRKGHVVKPSQYIRMSFRTPRSTNPQTA